MRWRWSVRRGVANDAGCGRRGPGAAGSGGPGGVRDRLGSWVDAAAAPGSGAMAALAPSAGRSANGGGVPHGRRAVNSGLLFKPPDRRSEMQPTHGRANRSSDSYAQRCKYAGKEFRALNRVTADPASGLSLVGLLMQADKDASAGVNMALVPYLAPLGKDVHG
jgi:hypothetical protein